MNERPPEWFDAWCRKMKMKPLCRTQVRYGELLIADSGESIVEDHKLFYRTSYAILRGGLQFAYWEDYDPSEYLLYTLHGFQQFRVDEATTHGTEKLRELMEAEFYDANAKGSFSKPVDSAH